MRCRQLSSRWRGVRGQRTISVHNADRARCPGPQLDPRARRRPAGNGVGGATQGRGAYERDSDLQARSDRIAGPGGPSTDRSGHPGKRVGGGTMTWSRFARLGGYPGRHRPGHAMRRLLRARRLRHAGRGHDPGRGRPGARSPALPAEPAAPSPSTPATSRPAPRWRTSTSSSTSTTRSCRATRCR